jgi:regulator of RNase E activity RraA
VSLTDRLKKLYAGVVYDAAYYDVGHRERFVICRGVRHLAGDVPLVGPAFTCWGTRPTVHGKHQDIDEADAHRLKIFEAMKPGDVVVMDTDGDTTVAHFGDITAQIFEQQGVAGVVIDGYTRDIGRIHLPTFARGVQPQDAYGKWALQNHGKIVAFWTSGRNRIEVHPGDMVFADRDGVMVLPSKIVEDVVDAAEKRAVKEQEIRDWLSSGAGPREVYKRLGRW